jgi:hypothetical protein
LDLPTLKKIDERDDLRTRQKALQSQGKDLDTKKRLRLIQLSDELAPLGFTRDYRDPIEQQFADAMVRRHSTEKDPPVLTPGALKEQEKLADAVLNQIIGEKNL